MVLGIVMLAFLGASVHGQDKVYKTPQDVFKAAKEAAKKGDAKALYATITPESGERMLGQMVVLGITFKAFASLDKTGKAAEQLKPFFDTMEKHGLDEAALKKMKKLDPNDSPEEQTKAMRKMVEPVKDKAAFFSDIMGVFKKMNPKGGGIESLAQGNLEDVKIEGNKAKGTIVGKKGDKEKRDPIEFERVRGSWLMVIPMPTPKGKPKAKDD